MDAILRDASKKPATVHLDIRAYIFIHQFRTTRFATDISRTRALSVGLRARNQVGECLIWGEGYMVWGSIITGGVYLSD